MSNDNKSPWTIGQSYLIRTVTHYYTGRVTDATTLDIVIEDAAWIPDTGRYAEALITGNLNEVEPYPDGPIILNRMAVVDAAIWTHPLPRAVK
jgi:hypothetical protein